MVPRGHENTSRRTSIGLQTAATNWCLRPHPMNVSSLHLHLLAHGHQPQRSAQLLLHHQENRSNLLVQVRMCKRIDTRTDIINSCKAERIHKDCLTSDCCSLQLENMRLESLVIADQHAAVNMYVLPSPSSSHLDPLLPCHDAKQRSGRSQVFPHIPLADLQSHALALELRQVQDVRQDLQQAIRRLTDGEGQPSLFLGEGGL